MSAGDDDMTTSISTSHSTNDGISYGRRSGLTAALVDQLMKQGLTIEAIAAQYGVSKSAVSWHRNNGGQFRKPREKAMEYFPWKTMDPRFKVAAHYKRVTEHLLFAVCGVDQLSDNQLDRLNSFHESLRDNRIVVEFDPAFPAKPGLASGGWDYVRREPADADLVIRVNEHTTVTDEDRGLWRLPQEAIKRARRVTKP
ncbi:hypothetical protein JOD54_002155 [Actinokineospora baliensis]|uniref:hypothetical protein n=1 Tax=Actinokineospora baliensis TaxID=547056 RepID=UPI00195E552F|nr:hypothetical protein [Actinokineospora baliensis]MBM7771951.1 hypothetical protein [Actinokineospora baliensis]